jgi:hypothetical protein
MSSFMLVFKVTLFLACLASFIVKANSPVKELDQLVQRWLDTERQISELTIRGIEQKSSMEQTLQLLNAEYQQLNKKQMNRQINSGELAEKRTQLIAEQSELEKQQKSLTTALKTINQQLGSLQVQLPPPLLTSWQAAGDLHNTSLEVTERLQIALDALTLLIDFQNRISIHEMAIVHPNGKQVWVTQLYLGAGQAWFVSNDLSYAGFGYPSTLGWQWEFDDNINAEQIAKGIAIHKKSRSVDWIKLPISISKNMTNTVVGQ